MKATFLFVLALFSLMLGAAPPAGGGGKKKAEKIGGVSLVSPSQAINDNWVNPVKQINAEWVAILPYAFGERDSPKINYDLDRQFWGDRYEAMREVIRQAKGKGLKVLLKPMVAVSGSWPGDVDMKSEEGWQAWEKAYSRFIFSVLKIGIEEDIDMLCIGTEFRIAITERQRYWRALIAAARKKFAGPITYAANWDDFEKVPFWDKLDYIGVDAYFPLSPAKTAKVSGLKQQWATPFRNMKMMHKIYQKPVLFTEFGYRSTDACTWKQWEIQDIPYHERVNLQAQTNAYEAFFESFWDEEWFAGVFLWQWYTNDEKAGGLANSDYTPQNKPVEAVIKAYFGN